MQTKLQELTEKIYREGVGKANEEAEKILTDARKEAAGIVADAELKAENLISKANADIEELKKNSLNELQLSARQAVSDLKQRVAELIELKTVSPETSEAFRNNDFVAEIIKSLVSNWNPASGEPVDLAVVLPEGKQKELENWFAAQTVNLLDQGLKVEASAKMKSGFTIGPAEGGYRISFSDQDFNNFLLSYLRPKLIELLFEANRK